MTNQSEAGASPSDDSATDGSPLVHIRRRRLQIAMGTSGLLLVIVVAWHSLNHYSAGRAGTDSGMFAALGLHVLHGKVPYRDIWEQKPPVIFFLQAFALGVGDESYTAVRHFERAWGIFGAILIFLVCVLSFRSVLAATTGALVYLYHHYHPLLFGSLEWGGGNFTTEYGIVFVLAGIAFALSARNATRWRRTLAVSSSGLFFSLAVFTKEPFLLSSIPWFMYIVLVDSPRNVRRVALSTGAFLLGALLPAVGLGIYLAAHGALDDWVGALSYSFAYVGADKPTLFENLLNGASRAHEFVLAASTITQVLVMLGLVAVLVPGFQRHTRWVPLAVLGAILCDFLGTSVSSRGTHHYYFQLLPALALLAACGLAFVSWLLPARLWATGTLAVVVVVGVMTLDGQALRDWSARLQAPFEHSQVGPLSTFIREHSERDDTIWVTSPRVSRYYIETGRLNATRHTSAARQLLVDTWASTRDEKIREYQEDLRSNRPKFVITGEYDNVSAVGLRDWLLANYIETGLVNDFPKFRTAKLYVRADALSDDPALAQAIERKQSEANRTNLIANGSFEEWHESGRRPAGDFIRPRNVWVEQIERNVSHGRYALNQGWKKPDANEAIEARFSVVVRNLDASSTMELSLRANTVGKYAGTVSVYGLRPDGSYEPIAVPLIVLEQEVGYRHYSAQFSTGPHTAIRITTSVNAESIFPNHVLWDDWRLYEIEPEP